MPSFVNSRGTGEGLSLRSKKKAVPFPCRKRGRWSSVGKTGPVTRGNCLGGMGRALHSLFCTFVSLILLLSLLMVLSHCCFQ